jgi:hypothetical protein
VLKSVYAVVGFFVLMDVALAQAPTDQTKQDNFLANIIVVMNLEKLCPSIQINKEAVRRRAAEAGVDLSQGITPQRYPGVGKDAATASALIAMMNDSGGPFPCTQILAQSGKVGDRPTEWKEFIQPKAAE